MAGGLLVLVNTGQENVILNGNPTKTFWKATYAKYTNFGLQKFRLDYEGLRQLELSTSSKFTFKVKRYADLLWDTYLVLNLPDIYSPLFSTKKYNISENDCEYKYIPYEFRWIKDIGFNIIREISINCGGQQLQKLSGDYLSNKFSRDFPGDKRLLISKMSGNIKELYDPANIHGRKGNYPNHIFDKSLDGGAPSIMGRKLYIPIGTWFSINSKLAFPLICLQYNELTIDVILRPINELFQIRNVVPTDKLDSKNFKPDELARQINFNYKAPDFNNKFEKMQLFLNQAPDLSKYSREEYKHNPTGAINETTLELYEDLPDNWDLDLHLISTYVFLSEDEQQVFACKQQDYLINYVHESIFKGINTSQILELNSLGLVSNWMWFLRRDDVYLRNEWANYTNWEFQDTFPNNIFTIPRYDCDKDNPEETSLYCKMINYNQRNSSYMDLLENRINIYPPTIEEIYCYHLSKAPSSNEKYLYRNLELDLLPTWRQQGQGDLSVDPKRLHLLPMPFYSNYWGPGSYPRYNFSTSGPSSMTNQKNIMESAAIVLDGSYRENMLDQGIYNYCEKYNKILGSGKEGLYCYNFRIDTNPSILQPSGAQNFNKYTKTNMELVTISPPMIISKQLNLNDDNMNDIPNNKIICSTNMDGDSVPIGIYKSIYDLYKYNYDLIFMEERVNIVRFIGGNAGLVFSN